MKIQDERGNVISGIERVGAGISVKDPIGYHKYNVEKKRIEEMQALKSEFAEIKTMLKQLLEQKNG
jgi:hypothetical protein